jgi:hypothetical protein
MIVTGEVVSLTSLSNKINVRLPIFESSGTNKQCIVSCNICYNPGNLNAYTIGDYVYVSFINDELSFPIIIGKIYKGLEAEATNYSYLSDLEVTQHAILPTTTTIDNINVATSLVDNNKEIELIKNRIASIEEFNNISMSYDKATGVLSITNPNDTTI